MTRPTDSEDSDLTPLDRINDIPRMLKAMKGAVRKALLQHKLAGNPVPIWQDGQVVWIPPEDIPVGSDEPDED
jgi:hypothetical protein